MATRCNRTHVIVQWSDSHHERWRTATYGKCRPNRVELDYRTANCGQIVACCTIQWRALLHVAAMPSSNRVCISWILMTRRVSIPLSVKLDAEKRTQEVNRRPVQYAVSVGSLFKKNLTEAYKHDSYTAWLNWLPICHEYRHESNMASWPTDDSLSYFHSQRRHPCRIIHCCSNDHVVIISRHFQLFETT
jgi:hypothetical protein